jgi:uncharacterized membrane protein YfhO
VRVDGEERPILRANYLLRGVALDPGTHTIRFWYEPRAFRLGAGVSAATVLLLAGGWLLGRRRAARPAS